MEKWLQRNNERLLRKLRAAVAVWALERRTDAASREFQRLLMNLSGRQTKRALPVTTTGLWVLQQAAGWLTRDGPDDPNDLLEQHLPLFAQARRQVVETNALCQGRGVAWSLPVVTNRRDPV